jgi:hypothetical protein
VVRQLRNGDVVEVRPAAEILATLDDRGELEGLPFMEEMIAYCGRRFAVAARAEKICDTITWNHTSRRMVDTVLLDEERCDGSGHGGCQAECRLYWKEAWLSRVDDPSNPPDAAPDEADAVERLRQRVTSNAQQDGPELRYRCQATQAVAASVALATTNPVPYLRELSCGNVALPTFVRVMGRAVSSEVRRKLGVLPDPPLKGTTTTSPKTPGIGLQPGDVVRVRSAEEIAATLNDKGMNRGLWFDREMQVLCGRTFRVRRRVSRFIDERTGEMVELKSDCLTLDGAACSGEHSLSRWFCPRAIFPYWREAWLELLDRQPAVPDGLDPADSIP